MKKRYKNVHDRSVCFDEKSGAYCVLPGREFEADNKNPYILRLLKDRHIKPIADQDIVIATEEE